MFVDNILNQLLRPFRELWSRWMSVKAIKGGIEGDVRRVKMLGAQAQGNVQYAGNLVRNGPNQIQQGVQGAQQQLPPQAPAQKPAGKKMSWFPWSKKTCPGCQNKLHKSWDKCPYCGMAQGGAAPQPGQGQGMQPQPGQGMPPQPGQGQGMPQQPYPGAPGYPPGPGPQGYPAPGPMPGPGGAQRTIAMDASAIAAPLLSTGDRGENVAWLVPLEGPQMGDLLQFKGRVVVGTAEGCDFKMLDASISSRHAEITMDGQNRFRITDLGSTNGTYVNDKKISSTELIDGDNLRLGRTTLRFKTKT